ncbi:putative cyclin b1 interacting protein 1 [Golovinomyces cichoracearum]|uniref:Putative cyclin b1 interacting protein 1 n=1 Tax=Golovinomyces cichoracearum TaxID=62708 RepID=A0A420IUI4_9PEZI|nr:putative cyclin b1 interacting protein 1 [Golovinomyces cichoracearum]
MRADMQSEQDNLRQKNRDISQQLRDRTRKHHETQELYDKLKRRNLISHVQEAASDAVEQTIQNSVVTNRYMDTSNNQNQIIPPPPLFSSYQSNDSLNAEVNYGGITNIGPQIDKRFSNYYRPGNIRGNQMQTPSTHRTKLPHGNFHPQIGSTNIINKPTIQQQYQTSPRDPLSNLSNNNNSGFTGYGMSAGLKVSNSTTVPSGSSRPILRSRVSQRQSLSHLKDESMKFDISKSQNMFANMNGNH